MRTMSRRHPWLWTIALLLLASLGVGVGQDAFAHTDDGCEVEVHCLACRTAANRVDAPAALPALQPGLVPVAELAAEAPVLLPETAPAATDSRGPPRHS
ncbi:MAG: hypothetical protein ABW221_04615 [Vicinamibacteria bacterium]